MNDSTARAQKLVHIFQEALDLAPTERTGFLRRECAADHDLLREAEELLRASEKADSSGAWDRPLMERAALQLTASELEQTTLDRYTLVEQIGSGGMGTVYLAVRADDQFAKRVAIKVVHMTASDERIAERFRNERQILAGLEHPNIVRLLDGGATEDGRPFLVMEYIEGASLARYLETHGPPIRQRLELFRKICAGVAFAHRNLVVHRDLKPSNILISSDGEPKLLDFGIAKMLDSSRLTMSSQAAMTLQYASPEQVSGAPINTSSDIYSLGVILYEMIAGHLPYGNGTGPQDLVEAVANAEPEPMVGVDQELQTIVMMALRKEAGRRYATAEQFSEDIQRYLTGYPVLAQPDTATYRARKFAQRNRGGIAAVLLVLLALVAGIISTLHQARIAEQRFNDLRKLAKSAVFDFYDAIVDVPGTTAARDLVAKRALEYLEILSRQKSNDPALRRELATAYQKVADTQSTFDFSSVGDSKKAAMENRSKALALREELYAATPHDADISRETAESLTLLGREEMFAGDTKSAELHLRRALAISEKAASEHPGDAMLKLTVAAVNRVLADLLGNGNHSNLGKPEEAMRLYRKALTIAEEVVAANPADKIARVQLADAHGTLGQMEQAMLHKEKAIEEFRKDVETYAALVQDMPGNMRYLRSYAMASSNLSKAYKQLFQDSKSAGEAAGLAMARYRELARIDPANVSAQVDLADAHVTRAYAVDFKKFPAEQLHFLDEALAQYSSIEKAHPGSTNKLLRRLIYQFRADDYIELRQFEKAIESVNQSLDIDKQLLKENPSNRNALTHQALSYTQIGYSCLRQNRWRETAEWYQRAVDAYTAIDKQGGLPAMHRKRMEESKLKVAKALKMK